MAPPPVTIYVTSLTSQPKVRKHIDLLHRSLKGLEIPYESYDLVMDEQAKTRWQRAKPPGMVVGLPGYLVGGEWVGTMDDFEYAVESGTLPEFLKQDQDFDLSSGSGSSAPGNASGTMAEAELEKLMRGMSDGDLDKLAGEIGLDGSASKVGLLSNPIEKTTPSEGLPPPLSLSHSNLNPSSTPRLASSDTGMAKFGSSAGSPLRSAAMDKSSTTTKSRPSMEEKAEVAREMMEAGTVDGILAAMNKAEGKEKAD